MILPPLDNITFKNVQSLNLSAHVHDSCQLCQSNCRFFHLVLFSWRSLNVFSEPESFEMSSQRLRVIQLYKNLLYLGRDYPQGYDYFRGKCHNAFMRNKDLEGQQVRICFITSLGFLWIFSLGGGMVGQGRLYHQGAGSSLHAKEVPNTEEEILWRDECAKQLLI